MTFLQIGFLAALPLALLPLIIHLINQWRYQSQQWGAMMFLLTANKMSRGYARLRKWLILAMRMLAVAGIIFAVSRPLASGLLGLSAGSTVDTTILLVDRSPSMAVQSRAGGESKLQTGLRQLRNSLEKFPSNHWVLIDSATQTPVEFDSLTQLTDSPALSATSTTADWQSLMETTSDYIRKNAAGRTEVWICSDLQELDWQSSGNRWSAVRDAFQNFPQTVRLHLIGYDEPAARNMSIQVLDAKTIREGQTPQLALTIRLERSADWTEKITLPLTIQIGSARSEESIEMTGSQLDLKDFRVALPGLEERGWGRVSIPLDTSSMDNEYYFSFDQPPPRKAIVVSDSQDSTRALQLAASISPDGKTDAEVEILSRQMLDSADWDAVSLLIWQGALPADAEADTVQDFLAAGGSVIFLPPEVINATTSDLDKDFLGVRWTGWQTHETDQTIDSWRSDQDLLAATRSGAALPVGQLKVKRHALLAGDMTPLASLSNGSPLIARAATPAGQAYFCATSANTNASTLATNGIVLYVAVQRAQEQGLLALADTAIRSAGRDSLGDNTSPADWQRLSDADGQLSTEQNLHAGVYENETQLIALNRNVNEDEFATISDEQLETMLGTLDWNRVRDTAGSTSSILQEVWRLFVVLMIIALIAEAILCLPRQSRQNSDGSFAGASFGATTKKSLAEGFYREAERTSA